MIHPMDLAHAATGALATAVAPWSRLYAHSKAVSSAVTFLHVAPLVFGAGTAFVMDRTTLRVSREGAAERERHLHELERVHRVVITGLTFSFLSGVLFFLADVETFVGSFLFWGKLTLVALLLANGLLLKQTEHALLTASDSALLWHRLRTLSIVSAVLWLASTLAGVLLLQFT